MEELDGQLKDGLAQCFEIATENLISKNQILAALTSKIRQLIDGNPDQLFSLLYRLDVSEQKIKEALNEGDEIPLRLANLVYERQLEKAGWRKRFKEQQKPDDDLSW
jgi:hypothetical protein